MNTRASAFAVLLSVMVFLVPAVSATGSSTYLTTGLVASDAAQSTQGGFQGVSVTYRSTFANSLFVLIYVDLTNSVGQTVYVTTAGTSMGAGLNSTTFFGFTGLAHGTYTAFLFAATGDGVPVSNLTSVKVTL